MTTAAAALAASLSAASAPKTAFQLENVSSYYRRALFLILMKKIP